MGDEKTASKTSTSGISSDTRSSTTTKVIRGLGRGRGPASVTSGVDSGLGQGVSSHEPSLGDSHSVSSQTTGNDFRVGKDSVSEAFTDAEEIVSCTEDEPVDAGYRFSNINCLFFAEKQKNSFRVHKYSFSLSRELSNKDTRLLFMKRAARDDLGETLLDLPNVLYTAKPIACDKQSVEWTWHREPVIVRFSLADQPMRQVDFFSCLLKKISMLLTSPQGYIPMNLLSNQCRFEVFPGNVLDVAERELIVRCASNFNFDYGTVDDIIEECVVFTAMMNESEETYRDIVERSLHELVVMSEKDKNTYVIKNVLWDEKSRENGPMLRCRKLNTDDCFRFDPGTLAVKGSRRTGSTHAALKFGGGDKITSFVGDPATGQQRQLALDRYKESMYQRGPRDYLSMWGIYLGDTAVVANGVVLQTDMLRMQDHSPNLLTTTGWTDRLSNLKVLVPARIRNWYVVYEKGDERLIDEMIENFTTDAPTIGIDMRSPRKRAIVGDTVHVYESTLNQCLNSNPDVQLFLVVMRTNREDIYRAVKKWSLSHERPIVTQIVMRDTAKQICNMLEFSLSVITQINCKLGGALWALDRTVDNTLVIGLSLYTSETGNEVLGFVSARNKLFTQWYSTAIRDRETELQAQLEVAIEKYRKGNAMLLPDRIVVLSNQIDDDEFPIEVEKRLRAVFDGKLTVVHVEDAARYNKLVYDLAKKNQMELLKEKQKRYIFVPQKAQNEFDLICCRVDVNDRGLNTREIAGIIKQLKHVYYNVAGEVNLPAPVLYAEKCAEFASEILGGEVPVGVGDRLYYL